MTYEEDLDLFRRTYPPDSDHGSNHPDIDNLIWELEKTVEEHPERWGWLGKLCPCGEAAEIWTEAVGYRCGKHFGDCLIQGLQKL